MGVTPTQRTLAILRSEGWTCAIVEKWIAQARKRIDAFGFGDILAIKQDHPPLMVQTTSGAHHADHKTKILEEPRALLWLTTGARIELVTWSKTGPRGKMKRWTPRREEITQDAYSIASQALP